VEAFGLLIKFKMVDIAMVTKVQKLLNLFQASRNFTVMFLVTCRFAILLTFKFSTITMETEVPK